MTTPASVSHKPRILTITGSCYEYQLDGRWPRPPEVPYLRLRGYWLQAAGFEVRQRVQIHIADQCITIVPEQ